MESVIQAKGQITLPKQARDELHLKAGDKVVWIRNAQKRWEIWTMKQLVEDLSSSLEDLPDFLRRVKKGFNPKKA